MNTQSNPELIERIAEITRTMDVPEFRQTSIRWLQKHAGIRNGSHNRFPELEVLLRIAAERGIQ